MPKVYSPKWHASQLSANKVIAFLCAIFKTIEYVVLISFDDSKIIETILQILLD